jgi:hypothetical protein
MHRFTFCLFTFSFCFQILPARLAVIAAAAAATPATTTTAVTVATSATAVTTTTTTTAVTAATATAVAVIAGTAIGAGSSFIYGQVAPGKFLTVKLLNCGRGFFRRGHFDKAKSTRAARHAVFYD